MADHFGVIANACTIPPFIWNGFGQDEETIDIHQRVLDVVRHAICLLLHKDVKEEV